MPSETADAPRRPPPPARKGLIQWQNPMVVMFQAMALSAAAGVYFFGWRAVSVLVVACVAGFLTEWIFCRQRGKPVTSAVFVTAGLLALSLPPTVPLGAVAVGAVVAVLFGKEVFGGFGRNVFNPAVTGRCFIYVCFANFMTGKVWLTPATGLPAGFARWTTDALTQATPLEAIKQVGVNAADTAFFPPLIGDVGGCIGETSAALLILAGVWLVWRRAADWRSMVGAVLGAGLLSTALWLAGVKTAAPPWTALFAGGFMFAAVFMVTDPVSSGVNRQTHFIAAFLVGVVTVVFRVYGIFPEGAMFAILFVNMFTPLIDYLVNEWKKAAKAKAKASSAGTA